MPRIAPILIGAALAVFALALPGRALAQLPPQGQFELGGCTAEENSDGRITIIGMEILFHESVCTLSNPVAVRDMQGAYHYDADCNGEGERWRARFLLMPGEDGGVVFVQPEPASVYAVCGPATPAPPPASPSK